MHQRDLRDSFGVVTHALHVDDDVQRGDDRAKIGRHWLLGRDQLDRVLLDLEAEAIDLGVRFDDPAGAVVVERFQCLD